MTAPARKPEPAFADPFSWRVSSKGTVRISRGGREVATLGSAAAARFLARAEGASPDAVQQLCARVTGNYKRGNESAASESRGAKRGGVRQGGRGD